MTTVTYSLHFKGRPGSSFEDKWLAAASKCPTAEAAKRAADGWWADAQKSWMGIPGWAGERPPLRVVRITTETVEEF